METPREKIVTDKTKFYKFYVIYNDKESSARIEKKLSENRIIPHAYISITHSTEYEDVTHALMVLTPSEFDDELLSQNKTFAVDALNKWIVNKINYAVIVDPEGEKCKSSWFDLGSKVQSLQQTVPEQPLLVKLHKEKKLFLSFDSQLIEKLGNCIGSILYYKDDCPSGNEKTSLILNNDLPNNRTQGANTMDKQSTPNREVTHVKSFEESKHSEKKNSDSLLPKLQHSQVEEFHTGITKEQIQSFTCHMKFLTGGVVVSLAVSVTTLVFVCLTFLKFTNKY